MTDSFWNHCHAEKRCPHAPVISRPDLLDGAPICLEHAAEDCRKRPPWKTLPAVVGPEPRA